MTQEEKQEVLTMLCQVLKYKAKVYVDMKPYNSVAWVLRSVDIFTEQCGVSDITKDGNMITITIKLEDDHAFTNFKQIVKPYLRPIDSMTTEEKAYYFAINESPVVCIDWLNKNKFDYRKDKDGKTMIERGLALEAPKDMYIL